MWEALKCICVHVQKNLSSTPIRKLKTADKFPEMGVGEKSMDLRPEFEDFMGVGHQFFLSAPISGDLRWILCGFYTDFGHGEQLFLSTPILSAGEPSISLRYCSVNGVKYEVPLYAGKNFKLISGMILLTEPWLSYKLHELAKTN